MKKLTLISALILSTLSLSGCGAVLVGAGTVVVADEIAEQENGGDGLI